MLLNIKKLFKLSPEEIEDSKVEITCTVTEEDKTVLFDEAVKEVIKNKLRCAVIQQLANMCYSTEQIEQTEAAIRAYGDCISYEDLGKVHLEYPHAIGTSSGTGYCLHTDFCFTLFIDAIVEDAMRQVK